MSFYWSLGGGDWVESKLTCGSILKLLLDVAGGNFPIFVVMIPQESGTRAGGSLSKKTDPKDLGMLIKLPIEDR